MFSLMKPKMPTPADALPGRPNPIDYERIPGYKTRARRRDVPGFRANPATPYSLRRAVAVP